MCAPSVAHRIELLEQGPTATLPSPPESGIAQDTGLSPFKESLPGAIRIRALDEIFTADDNATCKRSLSPTGAVHDLIELPREVHWPTRRNVAMRALPDVWSASGAVVLAEVIIGREAGRHICLL